MRVTNKSYLLPGYLLLCNIVHYDVTGVPVCNLVLSNVLKNHCTVHGLIGFQQCGLGSSSKNTYYLHRNSTKTLMRKTYNNQWQRIITQLDQVMMTKKL